MADRAVRKSRKSTQGDVTALCDDGADWSPRLSDSVISDIDSGAHTYHVPWTSGRTEIHVALTVRGKKFLRTDRDDTTTNNLDELPGC